MRWNSVGLDQMERCMCQKNEGNQYQIKPAHQLSSMEGNNLMVWKCMGWNEVEVQEKMDAEQYCEVLIVFNRGMAYPGGFDEGLRRVRVGVCVMYPLVYPYLYQGYVTV